MIVFSCMKYTSLRTKKGVIELEITIDDNRISHIKLTGDFFIYPEEALEKFEQSLIGTTPNKVELDRVISKFYTDNKISSPGITQEDWVNVIIKAVTS
ncbi:MAG: hypothetical protein FK733_09715 [Asgard group archaeon]|nr:hypothetical protein [Asgard group archaeon]